MKNKKAYEMGRLIAKFFIAGLWAILFLAMYCLFIWAFGG